MLKVFPSLISANVLKLEQEIKLLEPHCAGFHLDVMDFHFVPNLTWGPVFINAIRKITHKQLHVHLMVDNPEKYLDVCLLQPGDIISVHPESRSAISLPALLYEIKIRGLIPSIALKPSTPLEAAITLQAPLEHILLMSVEPGFSGQPFISRIFSKLQALVQFRNAHNLKFAIAMDGGINQKNIKQLADTGVNQVAIASAIFSSYNQVQALQTLQHMS
jgi:ribulose-phosphate 3-epimerase